MIKRVVIVGASRGIGFELIQQYANSEDFEIHVLTRNIEELVKIDFKKKNVFLHKFDLESGTVRKDAEKCLENIDSIDVLINNAGKLVNKNFLELSKEDIESCYQVNVIGVMQTIQAAIPKMLSNGAHVVTISSMGGFQGSVKFAGLSAYSTSKAAVVSLTEMLAEEFKESKIKFNCLCLGAVQTEMLNEAFPGYEAPLSAKEMASFIADFSLNGMKFMNGKILPVSLTTP
jgi:NAD(P)-dependent dehydrogenase (short-subunit alcohol dehydrogenase family)